MKLGHVVQQVKQKLQVLKNKDVEERWENRNEEKLTQLHTFIDCILQQVLFGWMGDWNGPDMQHVSRKQIHTKYGLENCTNQLKEHVTHGRIIFFKINYTISTTWQGSPVVDYNKVVNLLSSITTWYIWHSWVVFWRRSCTLPLVYMMSHYLLAPSCFCTLQLWWLESMWDDDSHDKT